MSRLELGIAWRYLRSRRGSKLLSLISVIAIGGVVVGVSALIVIMGVMTGLQNDLRELYNLVTLLRPGQLGTWQEFRQQHIASGDKRKPRNVAALGISELLHVVVETFDGDAAVRVMQ